MGLRAVQVRHRPAALTPTPREGAKHHVDGTAPAASPAAVARRRVGTGPINIGDAVGYGWNAFWKNVGPMVVIALVVFAINIVIGLIAQATDSIALQVIIQLVGVPGRRCSSRWAGSGSRSRSPSGVKPEVGDLFKVDGYGPYIVRVDPVRLGFFVG